MDTKQSIQNTQNIYNQFLVDWKKLKKIQNIIVNQALNRIDQCMTKKVLRRIKCDVNIQMYNNK